MTVTGAHVSLRTSGGERSQTPLRPSVPGYGPALGENELMKSVGSSSLQYVLSTRGSDLETLHRIKPCAVTRGQAGNAQQRCLDLSDQAVWTLRAALEAAYAALRRFQTKPGVIPKNEHNAELSRLNYNSHGINRLQDFVEGGQCAWVLYLTVVGFAVKLSFVAGKTTISSFP